MRVIFAIMRIAILSVAGMAFGEDAVQFFPPGVWGKPDAGSSETQAERDASFGKWYAERLQTEGERPLWVHRAKAGATLSIRMSKYYGAMVPDFSMVRIAVMPSNRMTYYVRDYGLCTDRTKPGAKVDYRGYCVELREDKGTVEAKQASRIVELVSKIEPFAGKTPSTVANETGMDGTDTLFEFSGDGKFNAMKRWELRPGTGGDLGQLQETLDEIVRLVWH